MKQLLLLLFILSTCAVSAQQDPKGPDRAEAHFSLHPNPVKYGFFYIQYDSDCAYDIMIYDLFVKVVLVQSVVSL